MANIPQVAVHHVTATTAVIWARSTVDGTLSLSIDNRVINGETVAVATADGCGIITVTGLMQDTRYPFTVSVGATVLGTGSFYTMPGSGSTFSIGFGTCSWHIRDSLPILALLEQCPDMRGFAWLGDQIYPSEPSSGGSVNVNGESITAVERLAPTNEVTSKNMLHAHYRVHWQMSGMRRTLNSMANWFVGDDHDHQVGNNWDGTIDGPNFFFTWTASLTDVNNMRDWCDAVFRDWCKGNPSLDPFYFNVRVNDDLEMFFVDGISYRDRSDGTGTTLLGSAQKAWLKSALQNSTATFKAVMSNKNFWGTADDFSKYAAELAEMESFINAMSGWAKPGGVVWCSGDIHYPYIAYKDASPMVNICSSPLAAGNATPSDGYNANRVWKCTGYYSNAAPSAAYYPCAAYIRVHGSDKLEYGIVDSQGNIRSKGHILPGANTRAPRAVAVS